MNDQYKAAYKQNYAWWDAKGADLPKGLFTKFNESFKAWEKRRGFATETDFVGNPLEGNESKPDPVQKLRGRPLALKLALESKKRVLAAEAAKAAKKAIKKGLKDPRMDTKFSPDIVGKQYSSGNNAQRKIKQYILKNHLIIPPDYEFGVNKIDWGKYEITGTRKQTKKPSKKNENSNQ
jgi:hypothetical protein